MKTDIQDDGTSPSGGTAECETACRYFKGKAYKEAMVWFRKAAAKGNTTAMRGIGYLLVHGLDVPCDSFEAFGWFLKAAETGDPTAQRTLGVMYTVGQGTDLDYTKSMDWFLKAAIQGDAKAQYRVGRQYAMGLGVQRNPERAYGWFRKAADQGDRDALRDIALLPASATGEKTDGARAAPTRPTTRGIWRGTGRRERQAI